MIVKRGIPIAITITFGVLTLIGLLVPIPELTNLILGWAGFLIAVALLLGVLNLFTVHMNRLFTGRNMYSGILVLSMLLVFGLAITDSSLVNLTDDAVTTVFNWVQVPLEAALASLLAFFLLFAGFRLLKRQRSIWSVLFLITAVLILISNALAASTFVPRNIGAIFAQIQSTISEIIVTAGMRGLLIGIALGTITLSLRLLLGLERPYNK